MGQVAYKAEDWYHMLLWTDHAHQLWANESSKTVSQATLLDYLAYAHAMVSGCRPLPLPHHLFFEPFNTYTGYKKIQTLWSG